MAAVRAIPGLIRSRVIWFFSSLLLLAIAFSSQAAESPAPERMNFGYSAAGLKHLTPSGPVR